jgi:SNARE protein 1
MILKPDQSKYLNLIVLMLLDWTVLIVFCFSQPDRETLAEYGKRVNFIKGILNTSKLPTLSERVLASESMPSVFSTLDRDDTDSSSRAGTSTMEIKHRHKAKYADELRRELLGSDDGPRGIKRARNQKEFKANN